MQEDDLKYRMYKLEIFKAIISAMSPVILVIIGFIINDAIQKSGSLLKKDEASSQQISLLKQGVYSDLGEKLNKIYIFVADFGDFRSFTPIDIIDMKRSSDRKFFMYSPYWSCQTEIRYKKFMETAFQTNNGPGVSAKVRTLRFEKQEAYKNTGKEWNSDFDNYFTEERDNTIHEKYYLLVDSILRDTANGALRSIIPECK